uniref:Uncharacterized protein n=1 Tax=Romanomermis culicivorax TaxID=13658 RepID=A0A915JST2_ROMCU
MSTALIVIDRVCLPIGHPVQSATRYTIECSIPKLKRKVSALDDDLTAASNFQASPFIHQDSLSSTKQRRKAAPPTWRPRNNVVQTAAASVVANPLPPSSSFNGAFFDNIQCSSSSNNQLFHVPDLPDDVVAEFVNNSNQLFDDVWKNADLNEFFEPSLQNYSQSAAFVPLAAEVAQPQFAVDSSSVFDRNFGQFSQQSQSAQSINYVQNSQTFSQSLFQSQLQQPSQAVQFQMAPQANFQFYNNHQCQQRVSAFDSSEAIRSMQRYSNFDQFI